ncbi:MAG: SCP2 sterol-binding domain-containing protein [Anaerolineae bacterium]|nr:SCP2 sterol-binding domain-containing protein [Anaerolineae bacterium]
MAGIFPSVEWVTSFKDRLNNDEQYARIAKNWEGDLMFDIQPGGVLTEAVQIYLDLWHGKCRDAYIIDDQHAPEKEAAFVLKAPFPNFARVLQGDLHPMQAMLTRKLDVKGNMPYMMRNVPTVLDFVRCAQDNTNALLGE